MSDDNVRLAKHEAKNRYELHLDDELIGRIDYRVDGDVVDMYHTEVDPAHGGYGYGQRIVAFALADARDNGLTVVPSCPFIARYIDRHPDLEDLKHQGDPGLGSLPDATPGGTMGVSQRPG